MRRRESLSAAEARRIALAAQHFVRAASPPGTVRALTKLVSRLAAIQIDSVNVLVRSHYLPIFSRAGAYPRSLLERAAYDPAKRTLFEYWGHEASLLPLELQPLFRWRMAQARRGEGVWKRLRRFASEHSREVTAVLEQIRERGPLGAGELSDAGRARGGWWGWSEGKEILEWLFWIGEVTTAGRRNFERIYDLSDRVIPPAIAALPTPSEEDAQRTLLAHAARALGIATLQDLRDYFRLPARTAAARVSELVEQRVLLPVAVEGWQPAAYLFAEAGKAKVADVDALLSPFDSLIWERRRTERLFDFHYRLEIYTPAAKRRHGYYVLPFLMGDRIVARVDLKAERSQMTLSVRGGSVEPSVSCGEVASRMKPQLEALAAWLDLDRVRVISRRGELMRTLRACGRVDV